MIQLPCRDLDAKYSVGDLPYEDLLGITICKKPRLHSLKGGVTPRKIEWKDNLQG